MESRIDIVGVATIMQSLPNHGVKSLLIDTFLCGFLCGQNEGETQLEFVKALSLIESVNSQLSERRINFEQKITQYNQIVNGKRNPNRSQQQIIQNPSRKILIVQPQDQPPFPQPQESFIQTIYGSLNRFSSIRMSDCEVCLDKMKLDQLFPLSGCPHMFHINCLKQHILSKTEQSIFPLKCPSCALEIRDQDLQEILDREQYEKYQRLQFLKFLNENEQAQGIQRCYTRGCDYLFMKEDNITTFICHKCNIKQCVPCKSQYHDRITCVEYQRMKLYQNPDQNDKAFFDLARQVGMKQCQQCQLYVEKNEGCDHMTCRCGYQFCYVCGGRYNHCECIQQRRQNNPIFNFFQRFRIQ